jgi:hypothetical protein
MGVDLSKKIEAEMMNKQEVDKINARGDSKGTHGGDDNGNWEHEPQGILQGNASGPHIWTVVSLVVFNIL